MRSTIIGTPQTIPFSQLLADVMASSMAGNEGSWSVQAVGGR
ncbi:MAG TPA: hypothetical protein VJ650_07150 [Gemmatimonadaceae bacterium]|nr:hypothetical protein [Gemmatimonadaceae bacterium]